MIPILVFKPQFCSKGHAEMLMHLSNDQSAWICPKCDRDVRRAYRRELSLLDILIDEDWLISRGMALLAD